MDDNIKFDVFKNREYLSIYMYMCSTNLTYDRDTKFIGILFLYRIMIKIKNERLQIFG